MLALMSLKRAWRERERERDIGRILPVLLVLCQQTELLFADIDELVKLILPLLCPLQLLLSLVDLVDLLWI